MAAEAVPVVMLTFGSHSMADFLLNWVAHVKKIDQRLYLVGALDAKPRADGRKFNDEIAMLRHAGLTDAWRV